LSFTLFIGEMKKKGDLARQIILSKEGDIHTLREKLRAAIDATAQLKVVQGASASASSSSSPSATGEHILEFSHSHDEAEEADEEGGSMEKLAGAEESPVSVSPTDPSDGMQREGKEGGKEGKEGGKEGGGKLAQLVRSLKAEVRARASIHIHIYIYTHIYTYIYSPYP
jgi:hypothetical protein